MSNFHAYRNIVVANNHFDTTCSVEAFYSFSRIWIAEFLPNVSFHTDLCEKILVSITLIFQPLSFVKTCTVHIVEALADQNTARQVKMNL